MKLRNCEVEEFEKRTQGKKIICFGAMNMPVNFCLAYPQFRFEERIIFLADNDKNKCGKMLPLDHGIEREIISPEKLVEVVDENTVVFITSMYFAAIIKQLDGFSELDNTECYIYPFMQNDRKFLEKTPLGSTEEQLIPKKIHYFWFGRGPKPELALKCIDSWKKFCPDWEIIEWNEDNYDTNKHHFVKETYDNRMFSHAPDYARLDVVYHYGGVYFDTDVEVIKNIDDILYNEAFFGFGNWGRINTGAGFGSMPGHSLYKRLLDAYDHYTIFDENGKPNPEFTNTIREEPVFIKAGLRPDDTYQIVDGAAVFPSDVMSPIVPGFNTPRITQNTVSIHHNNFSWADAKETKEFAESKESEKIIRQRFEED